MEVLEGKFRPDKIRRCALFEDAAKLFLEDHCKQKKSHRDDCYRMKRLVSVFGGKALSEITPQDMQRLRGKLSQEVSVGTINRHLALLKTMFNKMVEWGKADNNPASNVRLLHENNHRIRYLTDDEELRLK